MGSLVPGFVFPSRGWQRAGSISYGMDALFHGTPQVLVRVFPSAEEHLAYGTHHFLKELGVTSATIDKLSHVDGSEHYYVWGERGEVLSKTQHHVLELFVEGWLGGK